MSAHTVFVSKNGKKKNNPTCIMVHFDQCFTRNKLFGITDQKGNFLFLMTKTEKYSSQVLRIVSKWVVFNVKKQSFVLM